MSARRDPLLTSLYPESKRDEGGRPFSLLFSASCTSNACMCCLRTCCTSLHVQTCRERQCREHAHSLWDDVRTPDADGSDFLCVS